MGEVGADESGAAGHEKARHGQRRGRGGELILERQSNAPPVPGGEVGGDQNFQRVESLPPISVRFGLSPERLDDVVVVRWVAKAVHRSRLVTRLLDASIIRIRIGKLPVINPVYRDTS